MVDAQPEAGGCEPEGLKFFYYVGRLGPGRGGVTPEVALLKKKRT